MAYIAVSKISIYPTVTTGDLVLVELHGRFPRLTSLGPANGSLGREPAYHLRWGHVLIPAGEQLLESIRIGGKGRTRPVNVILTMTVGGHKAQLVEFLATSPPPASACTALLEYLGHSLDSPPTETVKRLSRAHKAIQLALRTPYEGERDTGLAIALKTLLSVAELPTEGHITSNNQ